MHDLKTEHCNWTGRWIWADESEKNLPVGTRIHVLFRKDFQLTDIPEKAFAYIAGDTMWKLYVNGSFVMYGVARNPVGYACVDELEVQSHLRYGNNTVSVEILFDNSHGELMGQRPGMLFELVTSSSKTLLASGDKWRCCICNDYDKQAPPFGSSRTFPIEIIDPSEKPASWETLEYNDSAWGNATTVGDVGTEPWSHIEIKQTPPCSIREKLPVSVTGMGCREGIWQPDRWCHGSESGTEQLPFGQNRIGDIFQTEQCLPPSIGIGNQGGLLENGLGELELEISDAHPYVVYDLGTVFSGLIQLQAVGDDGSVVDISWAECMDLQTGCFRPQTVHVVNPVMRVKMTGQNVSTEALIVHSMRYLCVTARGEKDQRIRIKRIALRLHQQVSNGKGSFICSDYKLNRIYQSALDTLCANTSDIYMDCPDRERGAYMHESYWMSQLAFYALGDIEVSRWMCRLTSKTQGFRPDVPGMISTIVGSNMPCHDWYFSIGMPFFILQVIQDFKFSGNDKFLAECMPVIDKIMDQCLQYLNPQGVFEAVPTRITFSDWSLTDRVEDGVSVFLNCAFYKAIKQLADVTGSEKYAELACNLRNAINSLPAVHAGSDEQSHVFYSDGYRLKNGALVQIESLSETTQYMALWSGVVPKERAKEIWRLLRNTAAPFSNKRESAVSTFMKKGGSYSFDYRVLWAAENGDFDLAIRDFRDLLYYMASREPGTLWEQHFETSFSLCHGFMAWAGSFLIEYCLGIRPGDRGGFTTVKITPNGLRDLTWARGYVTTQQGVVGINWHFDDLQYVLEISLPQGSNADITLPVEAMKVWMRNSNPDKQWFSNLSIKKSCRIIIIPGEISCVDMD